MTAQVRPLNRIVSSNGMFLRALYLSTTIGAVAAIATAPWQIVISLTLAAYSPASAPRP